jgi:2'-5' RNA ligase
MQEPRAKGTSLWLMPEGARREKLTSLIARLAARLGTSPFVPHVTLLPGVCGPEAGILEGARALASDLAPLDLEPAGVDGLEEHFRCLFLRITGSGDLVGAHARAARQFGRAPDPTFDPHLTLVYGALPASRKAALASEIGAALPPGFRARRLHVWRTQGVVAEWRELESFELGTPD